MCALANEREDFLDSVDENESEYQENQFLTFKLGDEDYGLKLVDIVEIIRMIKVTPVPEMDSFIKGIINLRGQIIPVMDIRLRFDLPEKEYDERTCIVVVNIKDYKMGLIVDQVSEVVEIPANQVEEPPKVQNNKSQNFVNGIGKINDEVKILLDTNQLLFDHELESLKNIDKNDEKGE